LPLSQQGKPWIPAFAGMTRWVSPESRSFGRLGKTPLTQDLGDPRRELGLGEMFPGIWQSEVRENIVAAHVHLDFFNHVRCCLPLSGGGSMCELAVRRATWDSDAPTLSQG
jgi:hypothetical protein